MSKTLPRSVSGTTRAAAVGALAWIVGAVQLMVVQVVVGAAWHSPAYSWADNNISDLGNVHCQVWDTSRPRYVCSPMHTAMNVSVVVQGVLLLAGLLLTGVCWGRGKLAWTARALLAVEAGAYILVGFVPADINEDLHVLGAMLIMGIGNIGLLLAAFVPRTSLLGGLRALTLAAGAAALAAAGLFASRHDPGIGLGGLERVAVFALEAWTVAVAVAVLRAARRGRLSAPGASPTAGRSRTAAQDGAHASAPRRTAGPASGRPPR